MDKIERELNKALATIENYLLAMLQERGMFESQAQAVLDMVKTAPENQAMQGRWSESTDAYPEIIIKMMWISTKDKALEWIDQNLPRAWYRPMFVD